MRIHQVMEVTGLTRRAIHYYEKENLINPPVNQENNYREYTQADITKLMQISVLRQLDIPIKEIKNILSSPEKIYAQLSIHLEKINQGISDLKQTKNILEVCLIEAQSKTPCFDLIISQLGILNKCLEMNAKGRRDLLKNQLQRIFPGIFGKILAIEYGYFLNESIDSEEKEKAWVSMVKTLDEMEELDIPNDLEEFFEQLSEKDMVEYEKWSVKSYDSMLSLTDQQFEEQKNVIKQKSIELSFPPEYVEQSEKSLRVVKFLTRTLGEFSTEFFKNLAVLSGDFKKFQDRLIALSKFMHNHE